ncbi:hypothetical protein D5086_017425 [Populus alba]|uniref:Uncharacterized protein n=1 Tax=Populus alba TaxID=43335 RepID=A0ACC4BWN6_POPAL
MAKSKKKSSVLRFAQRDYDFCLSRPSSSNAQRTLRRRVSPHGQHSSGPSWFDLPPSTPPRTTIYLVDVVNFNCEVRVRTKHQKRDIQGTPPTAPPSSSLKPCENTSTSLVSIRPCHGPSAETGSLSSWFGAGNPNHGPPVGTAPSPPPHRKVKPLQGTLDLHPHNTIHVPPFHHPLP